MDIVVVVSARKLQYFKRVISEFTESVEYRRAIKDTIANMDNYVFLTPYERETKVLSNNGKIPLDGEAVKNNFEITLKDKHPEVYRKLFNQVY